MRSLWRRVLRKIPAGFLAEFLIAVLSQHQDRFFAVDRVEGPRLASRPPAATVFKGERCHIVKGQHSIVPVAPVTGGAAWGLTSAASAPAALGALAESAINSLPFYCQRSVNLPATPPQLGIGSITLFVIAGSLFAQRAIRTATLRRHDAA